MAVAIDTFGFTNQHVDAATTVSVTLTVASNSDRLLLACFSCIQSGGSPTVSGVSGGGGGTWTKLGNISDSNQDDKIWYSIAPATGSQTVTATFSPGNSGGSDTELTVYSLYGVDQVTPASGYQSAFQSGGTFSVTITTATGDLAISAIGSNASPTASGGCNSSDDCSDVFNSFYRPAHCTGSSSVTFQWTSGASVGAINGVNVKQVTAAVPPALELGHYGQVMFLPIPWR